MYQLLAALISYPGPDLLAELDACTLALAPEAPEAAGLLERFRDAARELGQSGLEEAYIQMHSTSDINSLARTGDAELLWPA